MMHNMDFVATGHTLFQIDKVKKRIRAIWTTGTDAAISFGPWKDYAEAPEYTNMMTEMNQC